jgi:hypothetical protein
MDARRRIVDKYHPRTVKLFEAINKMKVIAVHAGQPLTGQIVPHSSLTR